MSVEEYQAIAQAAQADPQLMARLDQVFKEMTPAAQYPEPPLPLPQAVRASSS